MWPWRRRIRVRALVQAICGSCPGSLESALSGMRCWGWFFKHVLRGSGPMLPPTLDGLLQCSLTFRNRRTFSNYVSYVKLACMLEGLPVEVFNGPALVRARMAVKKRRLTTHRPKTFIGLDLVPQMIPLMIGQPELKELVMLFLAAYCFLLRVPSEGLPMAVHADVNGLDVPVLKVAASEVTLHFPHRKNSLIPTSLARQCWCKRCSLTCPVHVLGFYMQSLEPGSQPFAHIKRDQLLVALRTVLAHLNVPDACTYGSHSFRRGHAEDISRRGGKLSELLEAGNWNSAAFKCYLNMERLESRRVVWAVVCCIVAPMAARQADRRGAGQ